MRRAPSFAPSNLRTLDPPQRPKPGDSVPAVPMVPSPMPPAVPTAPFVPIGIGERGLLPRGGKPRPHAERTDRGAHGNLARELFPLDAGRPMEAAAVRPALHGRRADP